MIALAFSFPSSLVLCTLFLVQEPYLEHHKQSIQLHLIIGNSRFFLAWLFTNLITVCLIISASPFDCGKQEDSLTNYTMFLTEHHIYYLSLSAWSYRDNSSAVAHLMQQNHVEPCIYQCNEVSVSTSCQHAVHFVCTRKNDLISRVPCSSREQPGEAYQVAQISLTLGKQNLM